MATEIGIVVEKKNSTKGTPMLKIGNHWYVAGRVDTSTVDVGKRITFEWNEFGSDPSKPMRGLNSWAFTPDQPSPQEIEAAKAAAAPKKPFGKGGGGFSKEKDRALEIDLQCMRFVGQIVAGYIEKSHPMVSTTQGLKATVQASWDAIKFTKELGGAAPAPATASGQTATPAEALKQTPPGGSAPQQSAQPQTFVGNPNNPRPTGLFGYGKKYKDTPWNVLGAENLQFFLGSNAPAEIKQKCADELMYREQEKLRADQVQQSMADPATDDWDDDIPF